MTDKRFIDSRVNKQFYEENYEHSNVLPHNPKISDMTSNQLEAFGYRAYRVVFTQERQIQDFQRDFRHVSELEEDLRLCFNNNDALTQQIVSLKKDLDVVRSERNTISDSYRNRSKAVERAVQDAQLKYQREKKEKEQLEGENARLKVELERLRNEIKSVQEKAASTIPSVLDN